MLTTLLLRSPAKGLLAAGCLINHSELPAKLRAAAPGCTPASLLTELGSHWLGWFDQPAEVWLAGSAALVRELLPLLDRWLVLDCADLPDDVPDGEWLPELADFAALGFSATATGGGILWQRPTAAELIGAIATAGGCDLHLHTSCSDGADTPEQVVDRALANGLAAFAITDHDNIAAIAPARAHLAARMSATDRQVQFIPGVELAIYDQRELHLLGLFPRGGIEIIEQFLAGQRELRANRNLQMIAKLNELGYPITLEAFNALGDGTIGRLQAAVLLRDQGHFKSIEAAFDKLLGFGRPAYVERPRPTPELAIELIRKAGGVATLAHPGLYRWCDGQSLVADRLLDNLEKLKAAGLQGVEAFHGEASAAVQLEVSAAARALGLIRTGGSDDHGANKSKVFMYSGDSRFFNEPEILVVAALISGPAKDGQPTWLIARRSDPGAGQGCWELPGGKVEPGEQPTAALIRELTEELAVKADVGQRRHVLTYAYPERRVILVAYETMLSESVWHLSVHDDAIFATADEALALNLLPADVVLFEKLRIKNEE